MFNSSSPLLRITNLAHRYTEDWALKSIDFELSETGILGLLGSNGAGKSTLMNIVSGCLKHTSGTVEIGGIDIMERPMEARRLIGFLPQQAPLSNELNIEEFLVFAAKLRGVEAARLPEAIEDVIRKCDLGALRRRLIGNLSGGWRQRVGIAQAIIHNPKLVILDEPTVGLDPNQIQGVRDLITEIGTQHSVIISTHIMPEVEQMCSKVLMIESGTIVFNGNIEELKQLIKSSKVIVDSKCAESIHGYILERPELYNSLSKRGDRLIVMADDGTSLSSEIIALTSSKGWSVDQVYIERPSLEEAFAQLSRGSVDVN